MASINESSTLPRPQSEGQGAASAALGAAFNKQLMGAELGSLNLAAVRSRAEDIRRTLTQMLQALQTNAHNIHWHDALDKFAVLQVQYQNLAEQLRSQLKLWAVHPICANQEWAPVLPIMLATKPLPEMEAEDAALLRSAAAVFLPPAAAGGGAAGGASSSAAVGGAAAAGGAEGGAAGAAAWGAPDLEPAFEALTAAEEAHNELVRFLTVAHGPQDGSGVLDPKSPLRLELARAMRPAPAVAAPAARGGKRGPPQGVDALLAAVADGTGLKQR